MANPISHELKNHAPFTAMGALSGILLMMFFSGIPHDTAYRIFYVFHPMHVVLSALVTASMYRNYKCAVDRKKCNLPALLAIGLAGSVGIATLSDSIVPYLGEKLLGMPHAEIHIGFMEEGQVVLPLAVLGVAIAYFRPSTKFPHAGHVLVSTWASLFHMIMAIGRPLSFFSYLMLLTFLFLAVWLPCCISDIAFPLLFVGKENT